MTAARRKRILDEAERQKLKDIYAKMTNKEIMDILIEDEAAYNENPYPEYDILLAEARQRMLQKQIQDLKEKNASLETRREEDVQFIRVYSGSITEALMAKDILDSNGINAFLKDENMATLAPHYISPSVNSLGNVMVEAEQAETAKDLLAQFFKTDNP